ncbi:MAG: thiamine pyrophosphate-dependent dehydrogenase E1 component subunit alpha, partial [Candidatus Heimdallarchaeota archaeon]|nr:thiamine pyrophosphate-dependent dehydrogenase E1 component subunit alpha [Candidatus Heimdallarchaeota archaeon]
KDPIVRFKKYLIKKGILTEDQDKEMWDHYDNLINELIDQASKRPLPSIETMFDDVYETLPWHLKEQLEEVKKYSNR